MQRQAMRFRKRIPDRALEPVILAGDRQRQLLERKTPQVDAEKVLRDRLHRGPVAVPVEFPEADDAISQVKLQDELRQGIELPATRGFTGSWQPVQRIGERSPS